MELFNGIQVANEGEAVIKCGWLSEAIFKGSLPLERELEEAKRTKDAIKEELLQAKLAFLNEVGAGISDKAAAFLESISRHEELIN